MGKFLVSLVEKWIPVSLLLILGSAGVAIGATAALELHWIGEFEKKIPFLIYATVGLLALALGIERLLPFHRWEKQLGEMRDKIDDTAKNLLEKSSWAWFLPGERLAFDAAIALCNDAKQEIRALSLGDTPRVQDDFATLIADLLKAKRDTSLKFTSVYSVDFSNLPKTFNEDVSWRIKLHNDAGVSKQATLLFLNQQPQIGLGCLLVDDIHTMIGVTDPDTHQYTGVLVFRNQPEITKQLVAWFEDSIVRHAVAYSKVVVSTGIGLSGGLENVDLAKEPVVPRGPGPIN